MNKTVRYKGWMNFKAKLSKRIGDFFLFKMKRTLCEFTHEILNLKEFMIAKGKSYDLSVKIIIHMK